MTCKISVRLSRVRGVQYAHPMGELGAELLALLRVRRLSMELIGQVQRFGIEFEPVAEPLVIPVLIAPGTVAEKSLEVRKAEAAAMREKMFADQARIVSQRKEG